MAYDLVQSVFLMNMAANGVSSYKETQKELQNYLTNYLNGGKDPSGRDFDGFFPFMNNPDKVPNTLIGKDWYVVWGPGLCLNPDLLPNVKGYAVNAMYVAYSPSQNAYVVAIAATNPESAYDWMAEDAEVQAGFMPAWPPKLPFVKKELNPPLGNSVAAISAATARGLSSLLCDMKDLKTGADLQTFLKNLPSSRGWKPNAMIIFTGHSLAGALAPTLALYLYDQTSPSVLKPFVKVRVLPTAGATPGNLLFRDLWNKTFPQEETGSTKIDNWNTDFASNCDVVPHAWNKLDKWITNDPLDPFYTSPAWGTFDPDLGAKVHRLLEDAIKRADGGYYGNLSQEMLDPAWQTYQWTFDTINKRWNYPPQLVDLATYTSRNPMKTAEQLDAVIMATHVEQYYGLFDVVPGPRMALSVPKESTDESQDQTE